MRRYLDYMGDYKKVGKHITQEKGSWAKISNILCLKSQNFLGDNQNTKLSLIT